MRALVLAVVVAIALSACGEDDGSTQGRGPTDTVVPDDGPVPITDSPPGGDPMVAMCSSPTPIGAVIGLDLSSTRAGATYLCYACSSNPTWEAPIEGCLLNAGGTKPILCVPANYMVAGCK